MVLMLAAEKPNKSYVPCVLGDWIVLVYGVVGWGLLYGGKFESGEDFGTGSYGEEVYGGALGLLVGAWVGGGFG